MDFPHGDIVTHVRRAFTGPVNIYGDATLAEASRTTYQAAVWPRMSTENNDPGRNQVVIGLAVALPRGTTVGAQDQFLIRGDAYEASGAAADYRSPWSATFGGVVVNLTRVEG